MPDGLTVPSSGAVLHDVGAVILAGGLARRMGGQDKGLVMLAGKPMASYALDTLVPLVQQCVINANRNVDAYEKLAPQNVGVIADSRDGHLGPLAGLSAGIEHLDTTYVLMCPCDSPFVQAQLVRDLVEQCQQQDADIAAPHDGERLQPVFCVVHRRVKASLDAFLDSGERKIDRWFLEHQMIEVDARDYTDSFRNINTEQELGIAEDELRAALLSAGTIDRQPSCDDVTEPALMPVADAREQLFRTLKRPVRVETISLDDAFGRVLATNVVSNINVPAQTNSAMDGYAINGASIPQTGEAVLVMKGTAWAGTPYEGSVGVGESVRIFTGAIMPDGADTVVIQEHVHDSGSTIAIDSKVVVGKNVRHAGEDIEQGQSVLLAGRRLEASDVGVIASLGIGSVDVFCSLKVACFTTGDELRSLSDHTAGDTLPAGMLFDSNRYTLACLLKSLGVEAIDMGIVRDNEKDTREALEKAASAADVIVTSGGVSAGDADFVTRVFHELGSVRFWKLAMRPGRPLAFGTVGDAAFFGLPGNPVAVMVTFLEFVKPAIRYLSGMRDFEPLTLPAISESSLRKSLGRVEYQRGIMRVDDSGTLVVTSTGKQGAGRLSSMSSANCLIVIDAEVDGVKPGDTVGVQPFHGLLD